MAWCRQATSHYLTISWPQFWRHNEYREGGFQREDASRDESVESGGEFVEAGDGSVEAGENTEIMLWLVE